MGSSTTLSSETDSEVLAHLVARAHAETLEEAVLAALSQVEGTYGLAVVDAQHPDRMVVARNGSPLILGVGDNEMHVASDVAALVRYTRQVVHLDDGELVDLDGLASSVIEVPRCERELHPILMTVPLQLLAYHIAVALRRDVDKPRNLAKSVTVE